jgi:DNA repair exonuclease SbcCD ATPase subunit
VVDKTLAAELATQHASLERSLGITLRAVQDDVGKKLTDQVSKMSDLLTRIQEDHNEFLLRQTEEGKRRSEELEEKRKEEMEEQQHSLQQVLAASSASKTSLENGTNNGKKKGEEIEKRLGSFEISLTAQLRELKAQLETLRSSQSSSLPLVQDTATRILIQDMKELLEEKLKREEEEKKRQTTKKEGEGEEQKLQQQQHKLQEQQRKEMEETLKKMNNSIETLTSGMTTLFKPAPSVSSSSSPTSGSKETAEEMKKMKETIGGEINKLSDSIMKLQKALELCNKKLDENSATSGGFSRGVTTVEQSRFLPRKLSEVGFFVVIFVFCLVFLSIFNRVLEEGRNRIPQNSDFCS